MHAISKRRFNKRTEYTYICPAIQHNRKLSGRVDSSTERGDNQFGNRYENRAYTLVPDSQYLQTDQW
jgi:hypothetical protein